MVHTVYSKGIYDNETATTTRRLDHIFFHIGLLKQRFAPDCA